MGKNIQKKQILNSFRRIFTVKEISPSRQELRISYNNNSEVKTQLGIFISRIEELSNKTSDEQWIHSAYSHSFGLIDYCEVLELLNKIGNEYNTNQVVQRYVVGKMHGFVVFSKNDVENSYYATGFELYVKGNVDGKDTSIPVRFIIFGLGIEDVRMVYNWEKTIESLIKLCKEA